MLHPEITKWSCLPHCCIMLGLLVRHDRVKQSWYRIYRTSSQNIGQFQKCRIYRTTGMTAYTVDRRAVTFDTARRELGGGAARPRRGLQPAQAPPCCTKCNSQPILSHWSFFNAAWKLNCSSVLTTDTAPVKRLYCCVTHFHLPAAFCCGCNLEVYRL